MFLIVSGQTKKERFQKKENYFLILLKGHDESRSNSKSLKDGLKHLIYVKIPYERLDK